jgi:hypothetical protein
MMLAKLVSLKHEPLVKKCERCLSLTLRLVALHYKLK